VAGLLAAHAAGLVPAGARIVCTVTGHGLKDPAWALKDTQGVEVVPTRVPVDAFTAAKALGLGS
jgi:threonine synthase